MHGKGIEDKCMLCLDIFAPCSYLCLHHFLGNWQCFLTTDDWGNYWKLYSSTSSCAGSSACASTWSAKLKSWFGYRLFSVLIFQLSHLHSCKSTNEGLRRVGVADCALQFWCCIVRALEYVVLRILRDCCCQNKMIQLPFYCPFCFCLFAYSLCCLTSRWAEVTHKSCKKL